jgi:hypothetical protein
VVAGGVGAVDRACGADVTGAAYATVTKPGATMTPTDKGKRLSAANLTLVTAGLQKFTGKVLSKALRESAIIDAGITKTLSKFVIEMIAATKWRDEQEISFVYKLAVEGLQSMITGPVHQAKNQ